MKYRKTKEMKTNKTNKNMKKELSEEDEIKLAIEVLNNEATRIYPKGSYIMFTSKSNEGDENVLLSCSYHNKMHSPEKKDFYKYLVWNPPEWQNLTMEEALKVCAMFDQQTIMNLVYV
jgi:hypothetical protein